MKLDELSLAALSAAMRGGTDQWGRWGSARHHILYVEEMQTKSRRRCGCGCRRRITHAAMANGVALANGCELSMQRWVKKWPARSSPQLKAEPR